MPFVALPKASLTENALVYNQKPNFGEWVAAGSLLQRADKAARWWLGDWFVWGEQEFGDQAYQAVEDSDPEQLRWAIYCAQRVALCNRRPKLLFGHHQAVAHLEPAEQDKWLGIAEDKRLSVRELKASIKAGKLMLQEDIDALQRSLPQIGDIAFVFASPVWQRFKHQDWAERDKATIEQRKAWLEMLREPAEMAATLARELEA